MTKSLSHNRPVPCRGFSRDEAGATHPVVTECTDASLGHAIHEAGHAVAYILAFRALGRDYRPFHRVLIRRDTSKPYIDDRGRERDIRGIVEAPDLYQISVGVLVYEMFVRQGAHERAAEMLIKMQWDIVITRRPIRYAYPAFRGTRDYRLVQVMKKRIDSFSLLLGGVQDFEIDNIADREERWRNDVIKIARDRLSKAGSQLRARDPALFALDQAARAACRPDVSLRSKAKPVQRSPKTRIPARP
jgi:hypothetical protein